MIKLLVNMAGNFYADCTAQALERTGNFRVEKQTSPEPESMELRLREFPADILLLGVSAVCGYTVEDRTPIIRSVRRKLPDSRIVLFLDEQVSREQTQGVKHLRQAHLIDGFLYASNSMEYLVDTLESI